MHIDQDCFTLWGKNYEKCPPVEIVQCAFDPAPHLPAAIPTGNNKWADLAFQKLREAIGNLPVNPYLRASRCFANAEFALGLDIKDGRERQVLASIARGYAWTESYGAAYLDERGRIKEIHEACEAINEALSLLAGGARYLPKASNELPYTWANAGPIAQAVKANAGLLIPSKAKFYRRVEIDDLFEPIGEGLSALWTMRHALAGRRALMPDRLDRGHLRRVFVICLMEIFVTFTGELPTFKERKGNIFDRAWWNFLAATLSLLGFKTTGLRDLLRALESGGRRADKRPRAPDAAEKALNIPPRLVLDLERLRESAVARDNTQSMILNADDFPSSVMMREVADRLRPGTHEAAYSRLGSP